MNIFYKAFTLLYPLAIRLASPFNQKAKLWVEGRENIFERLRQAIDITQPLLWMHCSSLGEFEQGRPVLEKVKSETSKVKILVTFFSPSGYEVRKDYEHADYVFYLPMDSSENARKFFDIIQPALIIFVKYEFWPHYLYEAKKRNIPLLLISAIFRKSQPFFSKYGDFHRNLLACFTHIFVQNEASTALLESIDVINVSVAGDTRFDRVVELAEKFEPVSAIKGFIAHDKVIVAGSTWLDDDKELAHFVNTRTDIKFIIAPHNIGKDRLSDCLKLYKRSILFSQVTTSRDANVNCLIIDNIGMLSTLYNYATIAYVGGGFGGDGVHNVLEPAVYGRPVVFGPEYGKYLEAVELIRLQGAVSTGNTLELEETFEKILSDEHLYTAMCTAAKEYVYSRKGATGRIVEYIYKNRLLTS